MPSRLALCLVFPRDPLDHGVVSQRLLTCGSLEFAACVAILMGPPWGIRIDVKSMSRSVDAAISRENSDFPTHVCIYTLIGALWRCYAFTADVAADLPSDELQRKLGELGLND